MTAIGISAVGEIGHATGAGVIGYAHTYSPRCCSCGGRRWGGAEGRWGTDCYRRRAACECEGGEEVEWEVFAYYRSVHLSPAPTFIIVVITISLTTNPSTPPQKASANPLPHLQTSIQTTTTNPTPRSQPAIARPAPPSPSAPP